MITHPYCLGIPLEESNTCFLEKDNFTDLSVFLSCVLHTYIFLFYILIVDETSEGLVIMWMNFTFFLSVIKKASWYSKGNSRFISDPFTAEIQSKRLMGKGSKTLIADEFHKDCQQLQK